MVRRRLAEKNVRPGSQTYQNRRVDCPATEELKTKIATEEGKECENQKEVSKRNKDNNNSNSSISNTNISSIRI